ncbi:MAG TPA: hypothetical protein VGM87_07360 [Roseomonas sp.]
MKTLLVASLIALPALAVAQDTDSVVRRVIDTQLSTGMTQPPGPGVPGSEAARLLGRAPGQQPQAPADTAPPSAGASFSPPTGGGGR